MIDKSMDALVWLRKQLETGDNDLLREMVRSFAEGLMGAEADLVCGAPYREVSPDRTNRRNGYRSRRWDTRVGSIDLPTPCGSCTAPSETPCSQWHTDAWETAASPKKRCSRRFCKRGGRLGRSTPRANRGHG